MPALALQPTTRGGDVMRRATAEEDNFEEIRAVYDRFAVCVIKEAHGIAVKALSQYAGGSRDFIERYPQLLDSDCVVDATRARFSFVALRFGANQLYYGLADVLVATDLKGRPAMTDLALVAPLAHPQFDEAQFLPSPTLKGNKLKAYLAGVDKQKAEFRAHLFLSHFGECVVRANPVGTRDLLSAKVNSAEENSHLAALTPVLGDCLVAGQTFRANKFQMRGAIALNYYRLATAPRTIAAGAPK